MEDDREAIERVRAGDIEAYGALVRNHQARIRGYCLWTLRNAAEADDAAQEVFIKAYRSLGSFRGDSGFSTWLYRIAVNHCRDLLRKASRGRTESWDALREQEGEAAEARIAQPEPPRERLRRLRDLLDRLPEEYRTILILREAQGLSYQELADSLRCSLDAVKARLRRARVRLEQEMRKEGTENG